MDVRIDLLGGFTVWVDDAALTPATWRRRQAATLVKLLALSPGRRLHRERVIDALWPELGVKDAAPRLHKAAHYARRAMGDQRALVIAGESVALWPDAEPSVDAIRFERLAEDALRRRDPAGAGVAADAYAGDLLPDDVYEPWTEQSRERLRLLHLDLLRLAGRWEELVSADPADEDANLSLVEALAGAGQHAAALRQLERLDRAMRRELGVAPGPAARHWRDRLRSATSMETQSPPSPVAAPIGRDAQLRAAEQVLAEVGRGRGRVLFLEGPAGIGKTTLLAWLEQRASGQGMRVGTAVAAEVEGAWPYAPVLEALSDLCRAPPHVAGRTAGRVPGGDRTRPDGSAADPDRHGRTPAAVRGDSGAASPGRGRRRGGAGRRRRPRRRRGEPAHVALPRTQHSHRTRPHRPCAPPGATEPLLPTSAVPSSGGAWRHSSTSRP